MPLPALRPGLRHAPRATLNHLGREIIQAEARVNLHGRHGEYDRHEWWLTYLDRLRRWHWAWVRHQVPHLTRCPDCQRISDHPLGVRYCFACRAEWFVNHE